MRRHFPLAWTLAIGLTCGLATGQASSQTREAAAIAAGLCGPIENSFGPFDYRTVREADRTIVERFHFTPAVESLRHGSTGQIGGDLDYTLRAMPNHPRALYAVSRYAQRLKSQRLPGARYPAECYFDRAIRFAPDDSQVRALYADFLIAFGRPKDARDQLETAEKLEVRSAQVTYNMGLAWARLGDYDKALPLARRAYAAGVQFPGLRTMLEKAGVWRE